MQMATSGNELLATLEKLYILHPIVVNRQGDHRYWRGIFIVHFLFIYGIGRLIIGTFSPSIGLSIGNHFNLFGFAGQVMSFSCGTAVSMMYYLRFRLSIEKTLPYLHELVNYDDPMKRTILYGDHRVRMVTFMRKVMAVLD